MCRRNCHRSCRLRLEYGTGYAQAAHAGSWKPPSEDPDRAFFDIRPVAIDDAVAGGVADFCARDGLLESRVRAHEVVETEFTARRFVHEHVDVRVFPGFIA